MLWLIPAALFLLAGAAVVYGMIQGNRAAFVLRHRERPIGTVHGGVLAIRGRARPLATLRSRIGGQECAWYRYQVEEYRSSYSARDQLLPNGTWQTIDRGEQAVDFLVEDGQGTALVHPAGAIFEVASTVASQSLPPSAGVTLGPLTIGSHPRRYREAWIAPGQEVHVVGGARPLHPAPGMAAAPASIVFSREFAADAFLVSDQAPDTLVSRLRTRAWLSFAGASLAVAVGLLTLFIERHR